MSSLVPGFEYDIFISYRHNDNRSGWVTEFVKALKEELASTIKEPVSVYFDTNPHDGLLETHNVDKSLEGKLKCLIFIPIVSQTYCDPRSFAWMHEFCAFNKLSKEDQFGRDIKLNNGNVTSRILPIKIHDLDAEDTAMIENEIGGVLRAIEFIYKEAGVNRPLKPLDIRNENQSKTDYRNQVNKVANAIKDILLGIKHYGDQLQPPKIDQFKRQLHQSSRKKLLLPLIVVIALALISIFVFFKSRVSKGDNTVAVLAFDDLSPNKDQEWFSDGLSGEILNSLARLKKLKVMSRTSSFYFKGKQYTMAQVGEMLKVGHVVEGSVIKIGNEIRISAQLISVDDESQIWSKQYNRPADDMLKVLNDIAEDVARALLRELSDQDKSTIALEDVPKNSVAYEHFLKGLWFFLEWDKNLDESIFLKAESEFKHAITFDPAYASAYAELAVLYNVGGYFNPHYYPMRDSLISIAYRLNPNALMVQRAKVYLFLDPVQSLDSAFHFLKIINAKNTDDPLVNKTAYDFYDIIGLYDLAEQQAMKAVEKDPLGSLYLSRLGHFQWLLGKSDEGKRTLLRALEFDSTYGLPNYMLGMIATERRNVKDMEHIVRRSPISKQAMRYTNSLRGKLLAMEGDIQGGLSLQTNSMNKYDVYYIVNDTTNMLNMLERTFADDRPTSLNGISYTELKNCKIYDPIRSSGRFKRILYQLEKIDRQMREKYGHLD